MKSNHVVIQGLRIHYLEQGQGTPLLLLHGTAIDSASLSYAASIPFFAQHFRVIAPDWPGYGQSEQPHKTLTISDYSEILKSFINSLSLNDIHLLGFSMGGAVALQYALGHPLKSLTLVSSYGLGKYVHLPVLPYMALRVPKLAASVLFSLRFSKLLTALVLKYLIFAQSRLVTPALVSEVYEQLKKPFAEDAFMRWIRGEVGLRYLRSSFEDNLNSLKTPTLLLHGNRDLVIPALYAKRAAEKIHSSTLHIVPRCGHWLMREQTKVFQEKTLEFLEAKG
jgi:pimeloyl-ACP methyl ester carboxylesterase